jgi:hypothetical protein
VILKQALRVDELRDQIRELLGAHRANDHVPDNRQRLERSDAADGG